MCSYVASKSKAQIQNQMQTIKCPVDVFLCGIKIQSPNPKSNANHKETRLIKLNGFKWSKNPESQNTTRYLSDNKTIALVVGRHPRRVGFKMFCRTWG